MNLKAESGSIAPLALGLSLVLALTMLATTSASSLFLQQRRLADLADAATLYARNHLSADSLNQAEPSQLNVEVRHALNLLPNTAEIQVISATIPDQTTLVVRVCEPWVSPVANPLGSTNGFVCADSAARPIG